MHHNEADSQMTVCFFIMYQAGVRTREMHHFYSFFSYQLHKPLKIKLKPEKLFMGPSQSTRQTSVIIGYAYIKYINYYGFPDENAPGTT